MTSDYGSTLALHARGLARLALGDAAAGSDFLAVGRALAELDEVNPALVAWRSDAAHAFVLAGDARTARTLAREELTLARRVGAPRAISIALRAVARTEDGAERVRMLREATAATDASPARLERAIAYADLGSALLEDGDREGAYDALRTAHEVAHQCRAVALEARTRAALRRLGRRPRRAARSGRTHSPMPNGVWPNWPRAEHPTERSPRSWS